MGTLQYTSRGMAVLFLWLLWGDFAYTFFETVFGRFVSIYLKDLQASNTLIGIMSGSVAGLVNVLFLPNISRWSDQYRSPRGRRIPFLYYVTPLAVISLVAMGFAPEIGGLLNKYALSYLMPHSSETAIVLATVCFFIVSYHFFNMMLVNCYNWLLRDVVPQLVMARFLSCFRIVGSVSGFLFLWYVFPLMVTYRKEIFFSVGAVYLMAFLLGCRNVKEGEYPPVAPSNKLGILASFALYFRQCLGTPLYRNFFIGFILMSIATNCPGPFSTLFASSTLGLSMTSMGKIFAWGSATAVLAYYPAGWICDKFQPMLVTVIAIIGLIVNSVTSYFLVHDHNTFLLFSILGNIAGVTWSLSFTTVTMELFPREDFGQYASALNVFGCGVMIFGNYTMGLFMDLVNSNYRMTYLWSALFMMLALIPFISVCRNWRRPDDSSV